MVRYPLTGDIGLWGVRCVLPGMTLSNTEEVMFKAKHTDLVVTQHEHLKLVGVLALLWGNAEFEVPPCPFDSFLAGIALHDRGYGPFDEQAIGESSEEEWLHVSRLSFYGQSDDEVADLIVKHHIFRLVAQSGKQSPRTRAFLEEMRDSIDNSIRDNGLDARLFAFIDRITDLCDSISFDFCFQNYGAHSVEVGKRFPDEELAKMEYTIGQDGSIGIWPWPLSLASYQGYLVGYEASTFPEKLKPQILRFTISRS